jgi:hypothetical protein
LELDLTPCFVLNRTSVESVLGEFNASLKELVREALVEANLSESDLADVRLLGGGTRSPFVRALIGGSRTRDSDEYAAIGACYVGASQNDAFLVRPSRIIAFANTVVTAKIGDKEVELFGKRSRLHETANISFLAEDSAEVTLFVDGTPMSGFEPQLPMDTAEECDVAVKFAFGRFTVPSAVGLFVDDVRVAPRFQVRRPPWELTLDGFKQSAQMIMKIESIQRDRQAFAKLLSDFASRVREGIESLDTDEVFKKVATPGEIDQIREVLEEQRSALVAGKIGNISERTRLVDSLLAPVEKRAFEYRQSPNAWRRFDDALEFVKSKLECDETAAKYTAAGAWRDEARRHQAAKRDTEDPAVLVAEIDRVREELLAAVAGCGRKTEGRHELVPVPEIEDLPLTDEWEPGF